MLYVISGLGGAVLLIAAAVRQSPALAAGGVAAVLVCAGLHLLGRRRLGFAEVGVEIRRNPFQPRPAPAADQDGEASPEER